MKLKDLVKKLQTKDQTLDVQFLIVDSKGFVVCANLELGAKDLAKVGELFAKEEEKS